jgi:PilZ domain
MWAIHNSLKGWTLYGLNEREVQLLFNTFSPNELKLISLCQLTEKKWEIFNPAKHSFFLSTTGKSQNHFPELNIEASIEVPSEYFIIKPQRKILPRLHERIEIDIQAVIEGHNQRFSSRTVDLSEGGLYFKDVIPDWVSGYFIVIVSHANESHQIMCSLVEDQKIKHRVQVMSEESDSHYISYKKFLDQLRKIKN